MADPRIDIFSDIKCELGEGPTYEPATDMLWWFDIASRKLLARRLGGGSTAVHDLPVIASAVAFDDSGRQYLATERGIERRDRATGKLTLLAAIEAEDERTRSNDARVHASGAFWVGTMGKKGTDATGAIYHVRGGQVTKLYSDIAVPNSICFSPAGDIAYFADSRAKKLWRAPVDPASGKPRGEPSVLVDDAGNEGSIDGSVCDADGVIWNARWGSSRLDAYAPDGRRLRSIPLPARQTSCPAFVGSKADRIAVTSAQEHMTPEQRAADPNGGMTFLVDLPVRGRHEPAFRP
ncbi:MAG: SMP-30/gluconolactonase/LRE family protein [Rhizobiaceae bacterium]|nr:SMP-30/gluconolactonase/LRE family protein [Rhizobiaceae bacterium]